MKFVYVDFENMTSLKVYPKIDGKYFFFIGVNQKSIPTETVLTCNHSEVEWINIEGTGKNALDFHIIYYLTKHINDENVLHYILSKDKGFDPLISFINKEKKNDIVIRIDSCDNLKTITNSNIHLLNTAKYERVLENIKKVLDKNRPKNEKRLNTYIKSFFNNNKLSDSELEEIISRLYENKIISKMSNSNKLSYNL